MLQSLANAAIRTLVAPVCVACGARLDHPLAGPVCVVCWRALPRLTPPQCRICGDACSSSRDDSTLCVRCAHSPPIFDAARSVGEYEGSLRAIVHALKYDKCRALARPLGALLRHTAGEWLADADAVVPVPLHPRRLMARGFNQAEDLARQLGLPVWSVLRRSRHGPPQAALTERQRSDNVARAFRPRECRPLWSIPPPLRCVRLFGGPTVLLVDDVLTTGATANACASALLVAGARRVNVLTVARAVARRPVQRLPSPDLWPARRQ